jgi:serine/threonine protein kinase
MKSSVGKKLGQGAFGVVYKAKVNGVECVQKMEKYDGDLTTRSAFVRQQIFDQDIASKHPDRFLTLVFAGVKSQCDEKLDIPPEMKDWSREVADIKERNKWDKCAYLAYKPVLKKTLDQCISNMTMAEIKKSMRWVLESVKIMHAKGYTHGDIHANNIMTSDEKTWYLIDYGIINHKKFLVRKDKWPTPNKDDDLIAVLQSYFHSPMWKYFHEKKAEFDFDKLTKNVIKHPRFPLIKAMVNKKLDKSTWTEQVIFITLVFFPDAIADIFKLPKEDYVAYHLKNTDKKMYPVWNNLINNLHNLDRMIELLK